MTGGEFVRHVAADGLEMAGELDGSGLLSFTWAEPPSVGSTAS